MDGFLYVQPGSLREHDRSRLAERIFLPAIMLVVGVLAYLSAKSAATASYRFYALNHPNICTIHEIGQQDGQYVIVMELLEGKIVRNGLSDIAGSLSN
jgi:hypothetical protein